MLFRKGKKRILVADDNEDFLSVTQSVLEFAGFKVDTAVDGKEALKEIKRRRYDLLILDVIMPRIDGVKLFQMVRKSKKYAGTPVLFVSGYPDKIELDERKQEIVEKADAYIQKPLTAKLFLETVRRLLEK